MVSTRARAASATPNNSIQSLPPETDLRQETPVASQCNKPPSETPVTAAGPKSAPTNRKTLNFTIPGLSASASTAFPIPKSVLLHDWWLAKADGKKLAVAGFASRERQGVRLFCSAAIAKRHNTTTLETIDGVTVTISGLINRSRTHQNGFPFEVCNYFSLGFPYCWQDHVAKCYDEDTSSRGAQTRNPSVVELNMCSRSHSNDFQSMPVTRGRDILMSVFGDFESGVLKRSILDGIFGHISGNAVGEEPPTGDKTSKAKKKYRKVVDNAFVTELNPLRSRTGVATRSMTRLNPYEKQGAGFFEGKVRTQNLVSGDAIKSSKQGGGCVTEKPDSSQVTRSSVRLKKKKK